MVLVVKNLPANAGDSQEAQVQSLGWEDPLQEDMQPTAVFLPGESFGQKSVVGCSPWDLKESHTTEVT